MNSNGDIVIENNFKKGLNMEKVLNGIKIGLKKEK